MSFSLKENMETEKALEFVKSITEDELDFISKLDYGRDAEKHKIALQALVFKQNCIINKDQSWFPYEVGELGRWHCQEEHEREFAICNIIVALSVIAGADSINEPSYMLETVAHEYDKLDEDTRELVLNLLIEASKS